MRKIIFLCLLLLSILIILPSGCDDINIYKYAEDWSQQVLELTPGNDGKISVPDRAREEITLSWTKAKDEEVPQENLQYYIYYSSSSNISTVADAIANGSSPVGAWLTDIDTYTISGLGANYEYYFTILVWDGSVTSPAEDAYRKYDTISVKTRPEYIYMYVAPEHNGYFFTGAYATARDAVDDYCVTHMPSGHSFKSVTAFFSTSDTDMLSGISVPATGWEVWNSGETIQVAPTWFDLISNSLTVELDSTLNIGSTFWTGNGTNVNSYSCNGWTDDTGTFEGYTGNGDASPMWSNDNYASCNTPFPVLCVGWY